MKAVVKLMARLLIVVALGTFLSATLIRFAPGFDVDEQELNSSLSAESHQTLREARATGTSTLGFYFGFYKQLFHGDLGISVGLQEPVRQLLSERIPVTLRSLAAGLLLAWSLSVALAVPPLVVSAKAATGRITSGVATLLAGFFLCVPAAVLALTCVLAQLPGRIAIGFVVFPRVFQFTRNILVRCTDMPHVLTARAKGAGNWRVFLRHALPLAAPEILALAGVSICMALAACIPIEALCDLPGVGQLAWKAALSRDLTLLLDLTMIVTVVTLISNSGMEAAAALARKDRA